MDEYNKKFNNDDDFYEIDIEQEGTNSHEGDSQKEYTWHEDEYKPAMSGVVSDVNALSVYRPKVKKTKRKSYIFVSVVSSVITTAVCFAIFAFALMNVNFIKNISEQKQIAAEKGKTDSQGTSKGIIKSVAVTEDTEALSLPEIYSKASPSVVSILCTANSGFGTASSSGSGVIITKDGYIVTNNHVIDGASIITVKTLAGQSFDAQVVGKDERTDLAVLKVSSDQELPCAEVGDSTVLSVGDMAIAIGNPLQEELVSTLTVGYISAIDRTMVIDDRQMTMLQTDAAINPGNSGGALINVYGQVVGITTAKSTGIDVEGLGFAIPMNEAIPVIESIIENGYVTGRPLVGITGIDVTEDIAEANNIPVGVYVNSVASGSAAEAGGIKKGDVIVRCDGQDIKSVDDINKIRDEHKVGDEIEFVISRNGEEVKCTVKLQEEKPSEETETNQNEESGAYGQYPSSDFFSFFGW